MPRPGYSIKTETGSLYDQQKRDTYYKPRNAGVKLGGGDGAFPFSVKEYLDGPSVHRLNANMEPLYIEIDSGGIILPMQPMTAKEVVAKYVPMERQAATYASIVAADGAVHASNIGFQLKTTPPMSFIPYKGPALVHASTTRPGQEDAMIALARSLAGLGAFSTGELGGTQAAVPIPTTTTTTSQPVPVSSEVDVWRAAPRARRARGAATARNRRRAPAKTPARGPNGRFLKKN